MRVLPRKEGFPQRHHKDIWASKYVLPLIKTKLSFHRSSVTIRAIREDITSYRNDSGFSLTPTLIQAIIQTRADFQLPQPVKMFHLNDIFEKDLSIWDSSPGLPWIFKGIKSKAELRDPEIRQSIRRFWHMVKYNRRPKAPDCLAHVRSHIAAIGEEKIRGVWGYPATLTMGEAVFALPLIRAYKTKARKMIAYGYEPFNGGFKILHGRFVGRKFYHGLDFKSFDKTVPAELIDFAFDILLDNLDLGEYDQFGVADAERMKIMYDYIRDYFIKTPIRLCNGERYQKRAGVASGSYFTQLVDSVVNAILINWVSLSYSGYPPVDYVTMGDDSVISFNHEIPLDYIQRLVSSIGMNINMSKSEITRSLAELKFIGYHINNGLPKRDGEGLLAALLLPERPDVSLEDAQSRAVGIYYANLGMNDDVTFICEKIIRYQPFELDLSRNMKRLLEFVIGVDLKTLNVNSLPSNHEFLVRMLNPP